MLRGLIRDAFTRSGRIDPERLKTLFSLAAAGQSRRSTLQALPKGMGERFRRLTEEAAQKSIEQLQALPTEGSDRLLTALLNALGEEASGGASELLVGKVLEEIDQAAKQKPPFASWKDLPRAESSEQALFIIHDIARQAPSVSTDEEFRIWGAMQLREADISPADANRFLELATPLPLEGWSAAVRDLIRAYVQETDAPTMHRARVLEHFNRFGTGEAEPFKFLLEEAFMRSGHSYLPEVIDKLLAMPAKECAGWLNLLLNALSGNAEGPVNSVLARINKAAAAEKPTFQTWRDLPQATTPEAARFIIHDIAREMRMSGYQGDWVTMGAAHMRAAGISKAVARRFSTLAAPLKLEGMSEEIRKSIEKFGQPSV